MIKKKGSFIKEQIVKKMSECQWALKTGKGELARRWHSSEEDIVKELINENEKM